MQWDFGEFEMDIDTNEGIVWMFGPDWPNNGEIDIIEGMYSSSNALFWL